ncbi:NADPH:adrenodoxin oxidoreductase-like protein [Microthyrium microscopicum]|uniref:NADPH:adrenodoxin oxidoreductase, mitochondrial n=1 Tax=Microthyrium microscopicum TaxID=703497 RepID=A0A6A6U9Y7_9PEZI|nr:NADPH:adrenodoxin oxidoreductase-like protein [Microthyrium microscopicum]
MLALSSSSYICHNCFKSLRDVSVSAKNVSRRRLSSLSSPSIPTRPFRLAIIGSGPAGFYAASRVLREHNKTVIDMYEQLPVPFGLVRFGVAPDHPEVKVTSTLPLQNLANRPSQNCQDRFEEIASLPNFNFIGNIRLGQDIALSTLRPHYDAILFAYGASNDRLLNIPGENLPNILSAREFVAWYNGLPGFSNLPLPLSKARNAVIIGQGNVALDVARILLSDVSELRKTDTPEPVLAALSQNTCETVHIVGRRGPIQAAFTIKELRELTTSSRALQPVPRTYFPADLKTLPRARKRIAELLLKPVPSPTPPRSTELHFLAAPTTFNSEDGVLSSTTFSRTRFINDPFDPIARVEADNTAQSLTLPSDIAFRSIGYTASAIPGLEALDVPFNSARGIIPNTQGRVVTSGNGEVVPGMYVAGWVKRGPTGVIATTMADAFETADAIVADIGQIAEEKQSDGGGWEAVSAQIRDKVRTVSWAEWKAIEAEERRRGEKLGKPREKITSVEEMLKVLDG